MPGSTYSAPASAEQIRSVTGVAPQRDFYIDRLRSVMTALVLFHHTAITYGAPGGWFYNELHPSASPSSFLLTLFVCHEPSVLHGLFLFARRLLHAGVAGAQGLSRLSPRPISATGDASSCVHPRPWSADRRNGCSLRWQGLLESFSVSLESRDHHQRPALVCAGPSNVLHWLLCVASDAWNASHAIGAYTLTGSLLLEVASQRRDCRCRQSCDPSICACRQECHRPPTWLLRAIHFSLCRSVSLRGGTTGSATFNGDVRAPG